MLGNDQIIKSSTNVWLQFALSNLFSTGNNNQVIIVSKSNSTFGKYWSVSTTNMNTTLLETKNMILPVHANKITTLKMNNMREKTWTTMVDNKLTQLLTHPRHVQDIQVGWTYFQAFHALLVSACYVFFNGYQLTLVMQLPCKIINYPFYSWIK